MDAVFAAAGEKDWPEEHLSKEYFAVPDEPERENFPFKLRLESSGREVEVPTEMSAVEALAKVGIIVDTKCSDGICGVCSRKYLSGDVDHRDYVLSAAERKSKILLCCSRAKEAGGEIRIEM